MDKKTKGAWLIHHTNKLQGVTSQHGYENTFLAGKAGILLSAISADEETVLSNDRVRVLAQAAEINVTFELPTLIAVLKGQQILDSSKNGIAVLGVTSSTALDHTSDIFDSLPGMAQEHAAIAFAEMASIEPVLQENVIEELSDSYQMSRSDTVEFVKESEKIGFVDAESISTSKKLFFNGHLFRRGTAEKIRKVLDSLNPNEQLKLSEITETLKKQACLPIEHAKRVLGKSVFEKVTAIGLFDINVVSNSTEDAAFLTLPSAFSKYSDSLIDDAFDLAKAFVSSITYGMTKSHYERGQIQMVGALMQALVRGERVGPVRAIAEDYKVLELKGVVEVSIGSKKGRTGPMLRLLKKEVGELALQAIKQGDVSEYSLTSLPTAAVTKFDGPEYNRERARRKQIAANPKATNDMLSVLRTGGKM